MPIKRWFTKELWNLLALPTEQALRLFLHWNKKIHSIMREETVRKHKIISGINTTIICILLLLLFWFYNLEYEVEPLIREAQVEVELLPSGGGGGSSSSSSEEKTTVPKMSLPAKSTEQTNDEDAVAAKKTSK